MLAGADVQMSYALSFAGTTMAQTIPWLFST